MNHDNEILTEKRFNYTIELGGKVYVIENVPARVCLETGEQYFVPETVEQIHKILRGHKKPVRTIETPVYEFAAS